MTRQIELLEKLRIAASEKWEVDTGEIPDMDLALEYILELKEIKEYGHDKHRWYTMFSRVVTDGNIFLDFQTYDNSGDENAFDSDEHAKMILDSVVEVFPQETTTIEYVTKDKVRE